jgi:tetratricopeptide (TPR) repeat protein
MPARLLGSLLLLVVVRYGAAAEQLPPAVQRWQMGQEALRNGNVDEAIELYRQSLQLDGALTRNYLSLAAAYSAKGDDDRALEHLLRYVQKQPDHVMARAHLAEMLLRLKRPAAARPQFERCAADMQDHPEMDAEKLIHCESRLMELAESFDDDFAEHLHRGIGLYLLGCQRATLPDPNGQLAVQGVFFRAAAELSAARVERPDEARPCWYLHLVWSRLGQQHPANRWLRRAEAAAALADLTPAERRELQAACRAAVATQGRK